MTGIFPALDPNQLGDLRRVEIDALLIPYLLGAIQPLASPGLYTGDYEDIEGTVLAVNEVLTDLIEAQPPTEVHMYGVGVKVSASVRYAYNTVAYIHWDTKIWGDDECWTPGAWSVFVAPVAGRYLINARILWDASAAAGTKYLYVSSPYGNIVEDRQPGDIQTQEITAVANLAAGQGLQVLVNQTLELTLQAYAVDYYSLVASFQQIG